MLNIIDSYIKNNNYELALIQCEKDNHKYLGLLLSIIQNNNFYIKKFSEMEETTLFEKTVNTSPEIEETTLVEKTVNNCNTSPEIQKTLELTQENFIEIFSNKNYNKLFDLLGIKDIKNIKVEELVKDSKIELKDKNQIEELKIDNIKLKDDEPKPELKENLIRVMLLTNWTDSKNLCDIWNKMSKGNYTWNNIQIVSEEPVDYYVVINATNHKIPYEKTILFRMEPYMEKNSGWGGWCNPDKKMFLFAGYHEDHYNNNEWHLSKTYTQLMNEKIEKDINITHILSTVLSDKYKDPGHIKRIDFVKFLESKGLPVDVYGGNKFNWKDYKGSLKLYEKDNGLFPYKYTFNVENFPIKGYYSEKLIDGILAECLTFYNGCINIKEYINEKAYVWLELSNFENDYQKIKKAIEENWWEQRINIIRKEKHRILNEKQFFPRLEEIILKKTLVK